MNAPALSMRRLSVAALLRSPEVHTAVVAASREVDLRASVAADFTASALNGLDGDVLLVEVRADNPDDMRTFEGFMATATRPVIVTSPHLDVPSMRKLFAMGVVDALPHPLAQNEFSAAIGNAAGRNRRRRTEPPGQIVTFLKSGGRVGATTLAVQAACALSCGRNAVSVAVMDFDLQSGSAALQMDADPEVSLLDLVRRPERLDGTLLRGAMVRAQGRFDLLAAPKHVPALEAIEPRAVASLLDIARGEYALSLIDLPPLWSTWVREALDRSDVIVLVTNLTVASLRQAKRQITTIAREGLETRPLTIVANRISRGFFGRTAITLKDAEKALGRKVDYTVAENDAFLIAANTGMPLGQVSGGASREKKIARMMAAILRNQAVSG